MKATITAHEIDSTTKRTAEEITADIIDFLWANEDIYNEAMEELDSYNGYLGDDRYYSMDELDELYSGTEPSELLRRAYYGYDEETYTTDSSGNKTYAVTSSRVDTTSLKKDYPEIAARYTKTTTARRFTFA